MIWQPVTISKKYDIRQNVNDFSLKSLPVFSLNTEINTPKLARDIRRDNVFGVLQLWTVLPSLLMGHIVSSCCKQDSTVKSKCIYNLIICNSARRCDHLPFCRCAAWYVFVVLTEILYHVYQQCTQLSYARYRVESIPLETSARLCRNLYVYDYIIWFICPHCCFTGTVTIAWSKHHIPTSKRYGNFHRCICQVTRKTERH